MIVWEGRIGTHDACVVLCKGWRAPWHCGYVAVQPGSPLHGLAYNQEDDRLLPFVDENMLVGNRGIINVVLMAHLGIKPRLDNLVDVHGSLTFSRSNYPTDDGRWWLGFDCAHADDTIENCDVEYVRNECERLERQIMAIEEGLSNGS